MAFGGLFSSSELLLNQASAKSFSFYTKQLNCTQTLHEPLNEPLNEQAAFLLVSAALLASLLAPLGMPALLSLGLGLAPSGWPAELPPATKAVNF